MSERPVQLQEVASQFGPFWVCADCESVRTFGDFQGRHFVGDIVPEDGSEPLTCDGVFVEVVPRSEAEALAGALHDAVAAVSGPVRSMPSPTYTPQISVAQVERWRAVLRAAGETP